MDEIQYIPVNAIKTYLDRESPRDAFNSLTDSVNKHGVLVPITVVPVTKKRHAKKWKWELVKGHRRLRAAKAAGLQTIPAYVTEPDEIDRVKAFFIENEARRDLGPYELAVLMDSERGKLSLTEISEKYSMNANTVRRYLSILDNSSDDLLHYLKNGVIKMKGAEAISKLTRVEQVAVIKDVLKRKLSGGRLVNHVNALRRHAGSGRVTTNCIQAQANAATKLLREKNDEYKSVLARYNLSVEPLVTLLKTSAEFRDKLRRAKIDFSHFYSE